MQIPQWKNIKGYTKILNDPYIKDQEGKIHFNCLFRESFNYFIYIPYGTLWDFI